MEEKSHSGKYIISPNGNLVANFTGNRLFIYQIEEPNKKLFWDTKDTIQEVSWSNDSNKIAVVVTNYKDGEIFTFAFDKLVILKVDLKGKQGATL